MFDDKSSKDQCVKVLVDYYICSSSLISYHERRAHVHCMGCMWHQQVYGCVLLNVPHIVLCACRWCCTPGSTMRATPRAPPRPRPPPHRLRTAGRPHTTSQLRMVQHITAWHGTAQHGTAERAQRKDKERGKDKERHVQAQTYRHRGTNEDGTRARAGRGKQAPGTGGGYTEGHMAAKGVFIARQSST
jgi:hypothetical protein